MNETPAVHECIRPVLHIEILQKSKSLLTAKVLEGHVLEWLKEMRPLYSDLITSDFKSSVLNENVETIKICDVEAACTDHKQTVLVTSCDLQYHVYRLEDCGVSNETFNYNSNSNSDELSAANHWMLPNKDFEGLWESLVYDSEIKAQLVRFVTTTLLFSDTKVDSNIIAWNRVVLLHGPPGTGKTSLCKALAQKLCVRLNDRYKYGQLIEINSHSLFSKWFSESGKLVMKLFEALQQIIDDPRALVVLLIDEVESLAHTRKAAMSSSEPSDSIRVVNALLTQIDYIKRFPNVLILTTSNVTGAIDLAFVDRADIKQYVGLPSSTAIYRIYFSCLEELMRAQIIAPRESVFALRSLEISGYSENSATQLSLLLRDIAIKSQGLSGRTLRKLPFLAHAFFVQKSTVELNTFLLALAKAVDKQFADRVDLEGDGRRCDGDT